MPRDSASKRISAIVASNQSIPQSLGHVFLKRETIKVGGVSLLRPEGTIKALKGIGWCSELSCRINFDTAIVRSPLSV